MPPIDGSCSAGGPSFQWAHVAFAIASNPPAAPAARTTVTWIAPSSQLRAAMSRRISYSGNGTGFDRSTESSAVPESGTHYYINDPASGGDQYTTAIGSNRNTGKTPGQPKPLLSTMLRVYDLDPGDTVFVDTGVYK